MDEDSLTVFAQQIDRIRQTQSRNEKKEVIREIFEEEVAWKEKLAILSGQRFDDIGISEQKAIGAHAISTAQSKEAIEKQYVEAGSPAAAIKMGGGENDSVRGLYDRICGLEGLRGDRQVVELAEMLDGYTEPWVVMWAVVGEMSIGVSHNTIANAIAEDEYGTEEVKRARALHPDTVEFAEAVRFAETIDEPEVGKPFAPMLASSEDVPDDAERDWVGQPKLDGHRCLIHVEGFEARAFSRARNEKTKILPELQEPDWPEGEYIFDAEVLAADRTYQSTSERMQSGTDRPTDSYELPNEMRFHIFDLLVVDGMDVSEWTFDERMTLLGDYVPDSRFVNVVGTFPIPQARAYAESIDAEGIIAKHVEHGYQFGQRSKDWRKVKFTSETIDLRIYGFEQGSGSNAGTLGALKLRTEDGVDVGKVGTGFTDKMRETIWNSKEQWVGEIAEVSFDVSEGYEDGLRFPAFERLRHDKEEADSSDRLERLMGQ